MRGRPKGEPTEMARLKTGQSRKLVALAEKWGVTVRDALERVAGKSIDRVYQREFPRAPVEHGGES